MGALALYVETNFLVGAALGRESDAAGLFAISPSELSIFLPEVCIMEALSVLAGERKRRNTFGATLAQQRGELARFQNSASALALAGHLERAIAENTEVMSGVEDRLRWVLGHIPGVDTMVDSISVNRLTLLRAESSSLWSALHVPLIADAADSLIYYIILNYATSLRRESIQEMTQVLLTSNIRDFGAYPARAVLEDAGVSQIFSTVRDFLGWFRASRVSER
jgi:hypothetical protein